MDCETIRFSPTVWAKIMYMRDRGNTEIGGFGITPIKDSLFIEDFRLIKQKSSSITCYFDDIGVADHFDNCDDEGLEPCQYARIWIHTHPGSSPCPSKKDEETFKKKFNKCDFKVMFILAKGGNTYCRIRLELKNGLFIEKELNMAIDCSGDFDKPERDKWSKEYEQNVTTDDPYRTMKSIADIFCDDNKYDPEYSFQENYFWQDEGVYFYYDEDTDSVFEYNEDKDIFYITDEYCDEDEKHSEQYQYDGDTLKWMEDFKKMVKQKTCDFENIPDDKDVDIFTF